MCANKYCYAGSLEYEQYFFYFPPIERGNLSIEIYRAINQEYIQIKVKQFIMVNYGIGE